MTLKGLSLFANVGVAEAYFEEIGIDMVLANELLPDRAQFYQDIYPNSEMVCGDVTDDEIRNTIIKKAKEKNVNFIIATPPCQGMSVAGLRDPLDKRNQLIFYAIEIIKKLAPQFVLLENVPRLLKTQIKVDDELMLIPDYIKRELGNSYDFNDETIIRAKDYGVPQLRERNIFLLTNKELCLSWKFPAKETPINLEEAIGKLPSLDPFLREGLAFTLNKFPHFQEKKAAGLCVSRWHYPPTHSWKQVNWMMHTRSGESAIFNEIFFPQKENGTKIVAHHNHYRRLNWEKPGRTITQNNGVISSLSCVHPGRRYEQDGEVLYSDARVLSIYEILIVMSLPKDWNIPEWASDSFIRKVIGEGIPPLMVKKVMLNLLLQLDAKGEIE